MFTKKPMGYFLGLKRKCYHKSIENASTLSPETILSSANRVRCVARLQELKSMGLRMVSDNPEKRAAVLVPLCMVHQELSLLYTLRSSDLKSYRGQVSFPGGMYDETDATLQETALRETHEELGIAKDQIDIWGHGNAVSTVSKDMSVLPYLGYIKGDLTLDTLKLNPHEVESVFSIPLTVLCNPSNCKYTQFRDSYILPVFLGGEYKIWGMTAIITHIVLGALLPDVYKNRLKWIKPVKAT